MSLDTKEKQIGEANFQVVQIPAKEGQILLTKITKMVGPSLIQFLESNDSASMVKAASILLQDMNEAEVTHVTGKLSRYSKIDTSGGTNFVPLDPLYDEYFAGNYGQLVEWIAFALEVQYGNLSESVRNLLGWVPADTELPSKP